MSEHTLLDVKGLNCPLPIMKAKKALEAVAVGSTLEVHSTDPGSVNDFASFCRKTGHELLDQRKEGAAFIYVIKRGR